MIVYTSSVYTRKEDSVYTVCMATVGSMYCWLKPYNKSMIVFPTAVYAMEVENEYLYDYSLATHVCQDLHGDLMTHAELTVLWQNGFRLEW